MLTVKPGVRTSEFWLAMLTMIAAIVPAVATMLRGYPTAAAALTAVGLIVPALYVLGRAVLKAELAKETNIVPDHWEPIIAKALDVIESMAKAMPVQPPAGEATKP